MFQTLSSLLLKIHGTFLISPIFYQIHNPYLLDSLVQSSVSPKPIWCPSSRFPDSWFFHLFFVNYINNLLTKVLSVADVCIVKYCLQEILLPHYIASCEVSDTVVPENSAKCFNRVILRSCVLPIILSLMS